MRNRVRFLLGDELREIGDLDPTLSLLDWLRGPERLTGTKEGCNEGDCGACTVVVVRPEEGRLRYRAVNACILFVGQLDGCQLLIVEHLRDGAALHPVQQALVDFHGSQCGFCTPGFVMSLFAFGKHQDEPPEDDAIDDALAGNLCRCTGYAPIVRAAKSAFAARDRFDAAAAGTLSRLQALADDETVVLEGRGRRFFAPAGEDELAAILLEHPDAVIVAGSTDVGLWVTKAMRVLDPVVWIGRIAALKRTSETEGTIEIGAAVTYSESCGPLARYYPDIGEIFRRHGSTQTRNVGTVCGNIANGSPIGDATPALIAAGATLHLRRGGERRSMPLEAYFLGYGRQDRRPGEFVERVSVAKPATGTLYRAYKVSKRFDQDISALLGAFCLRIEDGRIVEARIAFGGMAAIPQRARRAEEALAGAALGPQALAAAKRALCEDFSPLTDMRASAGYRLKAAQNLFDRFGYEISSGEVETRLARTRKKVAPKVAHG